MSATWSFFNFLLLQRAFWGFVNLGYVELCLVVLLNLFGGVVVLSSFVQGLLLLQSLLLSLFVISGKVAVLTHAAWVVRPVEVATGIGLLVLSFSVVAVVAHVLRVVLPVCMWALQNLSSLPLCLAQYLLQILSVYDSLSSGLFLFLWLHVILLWTW